MKRLVAEHFRPDGRAKRAWRTEAEAKRAAYAYNREAYRCTFCGQWHIGR
jgi:hypothetical protein